MKIKLIFHKPETMRSEIQGFKEMRSQKSNITTRDANLFLKNNQISIHLEKIDLTIIFMSTRKGAKTPLHRRMKTQIKEFLIK